MQRVLAGYYNRALQTRGKVDTFGIVKFHPAQRGVATTFEGSFPDDIKRDQVWIGENAVGDWFYKPDNVYSARALILYMLEVVSRDGNYAVNVSLMPDGTLDQGSQQLLGQVGEWMKIHGEAIYGSSAWVKFGEGKLNKKEICGPFPTASWARIRPGSASAPRISGSPKARMARSTPLRWRFPRREHASSSLRWAPMPTCWPRPSVQLHCWAARRGWSGSRGRKGWPSFARHSCLRRLRLRSRFSK